MSRFIALFISSVAIGVFEAALFMLGEHALSAITNAIILYALVFYILILED